MEEMIAGWKAWKEEMAEDVYERVLSRMERQLSKCNRMERPRKYIFLSEEWSKRCTFPKNI